MTTKRVIKWLDDAHRVFGRLERIFGKLEKVALEAYVLATLIYALFKIIAHH
jgi:hypothetical protein